MITTISLLTAHSIGLLSNSVNLIRVLAFFSKFYSIRLRLVTEPRRGRAQFSREYHTD